MLLIFASLIGRGTEGIIKVPSIHASSLFSESMTLHQGEIVKNHQKFCQEQSSCPDKVAYVPAIDDEQTIDFDAKVGVHGFDFDLDGYSLEDKAVGSSQFSGLDRLSATAKLKKFNVLNCITPIPSLVSMFPSFSFGDWKVVSFDQTKNDCAVIALMDLIYTYKLSNICDLIGDRSVDSIYNSIAQAIGYNAESGTELSNIASGFNSWLPSSWRLENVNEDPNVPHLVIYESNVANENSHAAIKIGNITYRQLGLPTIHRDLVVSYSCNFLGDTPTDIIESMENCFYTVGTSYRKASYTLTRVG
mgnify:CR=1 FL=1